MPNRRKGGLWGLMLWGLFVLYCALPLIATVLFSLSTQWTTTILPEGLSVESYRAMVAESAFLPSLWRSTVLALGTLVIVAVVCILLLTWAHIRAPELGLRHREADEQRGDPVSEAQVLPGRPHVDRDHRPEPAARGLLAPGQQQPAQPAKS